MASKEKQDDVITRSSSGKFWETATTDSKRMVWVGRVMSALVVLFLLVDGVGKVLRLETAVEGTVQLGYPEGLVVEIGIVLLSCTVIYVIPRTSILGAILLTGYLGGATATQVRVEDPWFLFPVLFGVLLWAGLFVRDARLRALMPLRTGRLEGEQPQPTEGE